MANGGEFGQNATVCHPVENGVIFYTVCHRRWQMVEQDVQLVIVLRILMALCILSLNVT